MTDTSNMNVIRVTDGNAVWWHVTRGNMAGEFETVSDYIPDEATAQLIAAAPDMPTALRGAQRLILDMGSIIRDLDDNHEWLEFWTQDGNYLCCDSRFDAIDAAIARAAGLER